MNKYQAEQLLADVTADQRYDLLMFLAEEFDCRVFRDFEDITFFLSTGDKPTVAQVTQVARDYDGDPIILDREYEYLNLTVRVIEIQCEQVVFETRFGERGTVNSEELQAR